jgi:nucleotide-binding universal stress UspA family protein
MYRNILLCLDNSEQSDYAMEAALTIGAASGSEVAGCHVYAAKLHESRFMDMETGLPAQYQSEAILRRQREIHEGLIGKGLGIIADSYLAKLEAAARMKGVPIRRRNREGKNYVEIVREADEGGYDLAVIGGLGKGAVEYSIIGGVCERVVRGLRKDILVVKNKSFAGRIIACIDGSPCSYAALMSALALSRVFGGRVEAVAAYDPYFHKVAFSNIAGALSEEASKIFRFKEQEKLHDEIIDKGLANLYQSHLDTAYRVAMARGVEIKTTLLVGKAYDEILKSCRAGADTSFLVLGRFGLHRVSESAIGNTTENVLRMAASNVFIAAGELNVYDKKEDSAMDRKWTDAALKRLENVPAFARGMAKKAIEDLAAKKGCSEITEELVMEAKKSFGM